MTRFTIALFALSAVALLASLTFGTSHSGHASAKPVKSAQPYTNTLGMAGYSPVSYLDRNRAEPGSPRFAVEYEGVTYFLTSDKQRRTFQANPDRYLPAYGGYCAFGCSINAKLIPDPMSFKIIDGRTHLFLKNAEIDALKLWNDENESEVQAKANQYWQSQTVSRAYLGAQNAPASGVAIDGFSPVSYFTQGRAEKGDPKFTTEHEGLTYYFTSAAQVETFRKNPAKYQPQYGGWCAFGMAVRDKFPIDPTLYKIVDDKLYLFLRNDQINALDLWNDGNEAELLRKAETHWKKVSGK